MQENNRKLNHFIKEYGLRLNEQQRSAVLRTQGKTLLLAVPEAARPR